MDAEKKESCPSEEQLEAYVAGTCTPDERADIEAHLASCADCRAYIDDSRANNQVVDSVRRVMRDSGSGGIPRNPQTGELLIDGYEIIEEIGRGGMGVVYKALQTGTRRVVALKVMLDGPLASQTAKRRFEREIELAAGLSHPNIIAIHDSGLSHGHYFFAMDYIDGERLDRYAKRCDLSIEARLGLMQTICHAIHYAHQRGVIHRDLKPSNILIDPQGQPHILDFGLAKTVASTPGESLLISISGEVLGTLPYMAPEQARGQAHEIDCRTDVYALGVIFYEMLTGRYPYPVAGQMAEVLRHIAESEPARPSTIHRTIKNDLETIVLKTLSKSKESRYESAGALAADIAHYVAGEAIEAKRDSGWYILRKTLRRHKLPVGIAATFLLLATTASLVTFQLYRQADRAGARALIARQEAQQSAQQLAEELQARTIQAARDLTLAGNFFQAETLLWREFLQDPGDPLSLWSLRELYAQQPCMGKVQASTAPVATLAFDPTGHRLVTADLQGVIKVWDMPTCRHTATIITQATDIISVAISPDGEHLAIAGSDQTVRLLEAASGKVLYKWKGAPTPREPDTGRTPAQTITVSAGIAAGNATDDDNKPAESAGINARPAYRVAFSPDSRLLAACAGTDVRLWDVATGTEIARLAGHHDEVTTVAFSPDGTTLASGAKDRSILLWDLQTRTPRASLVSHLDTISCVAFSPDGQLLASASWDGSVIAWQVSSGTCLASIDGFSCWVHSVAFSPDGQTLATGDIHGHLRFWDIATGKCVLSIPAHTEGMQQALLPAVVLAFRPQGDLLATSAGMGAVKLWDLARNRGMLKLAQSPQPVASVQFDDDGKTLTARTADGTTMSYDLADPAAPGGGSKQPARATLPTTAAGWDDPHLAQQQQPKATSPDGKWLAEGGPDGARLFDASSHRLLSALDGLEGPVYSVAFSPDSRFLATADPQAVRLWQIPSGRAVATLLGDGRLAWGLRFSPDGRLLACAGNAGVRMWDLARYDRCLLGNYAYFLEQAGRSPDLAESIDPDEVDRWAQTLAAAGEQPLWMVETAHPDPSSTTTAIAPGVIAEWGRLTRHRLLTSLRDTGNVPPTADAGVVGAIDPPAAALTFHAGSGLVRHHTITPSGLSDERLRSAEYQHQRQTTSHAQTTQPAGGSADAPAHDRTLSRH